ncbi:SNARE associated Golgi protein [uncultured archaeon]|nr:SNARE associated Golgi protein [uncultured archaeon]
MSVSFFSWLGNLQVHGYLFIFLLMLIEGPIITAAAAFAASLGFFNVWVILLLSIFGNLIPDTLFFFLGRSGRTKPIEYFVRKFGLSKKKIKELEKGLREHAGKTITFVKLVPPLPIPGLILTGFAKVPFKKFLYIDVIVNVIYSVFFVIAGFYLGFAASQIFSYFKIGQYAILLLIPLAILVYLVYKKLSLRIKRGVL